MTARREDWRLSDVRRVHHATARSTLATSSLRIRPPLPRQAGRDPKNHQGPAGRRGQGSNTTLPRRYEPL